MQSWWKAHLQAQTQATPELIDTGDYVFSNNSNFLPSNSRFGSNPRYKLRRNDHLALARENSLYNLLQYAEKEKQEEVKVITSSHLTTSQTHT